ncbi:uncharacterized protein PV07_10061 [Cladophialophora immunda]|uniref:Zn(2)-C6 fungal-type domain-containing protein n=1 Tax=Cladophialophora immunda TaxID=569365 RepID=A0A0D2AHG7_9EURO|nr:uncharacterized protein PV07_10061 [Cladophialophora immunda]KIW24342.1 hypothetical protein PV07_10061 [Cladophialophora immunda]
MAPNRGKRHQPKSRTACLTCRKRKLKCGEERPHCQRCLKAGKMCEGYQMLLIDGAMSVSGRVWTVPPIDGVCISGSASSLLSAFTATADEWQAYRLYTQQISSTLGGPFSLDADLWQRLVLQISRHDAAVRNAIFTLGNFFRHAVQESNNGQMSTCACRRCVQALRSYNRAIAASFAEQSSANVKDDPVALNAALTSCALFICIEFFRKSDRNAIALIDRGCGMLLQSLRQAPQDLQTSRVDPGLWNLFARLRVLSASFGHAGQWQMSPLGNSAPRAIREPLPPLSDRLERARNSLYDILTAALRLRRRCAETLIPMWPSKRTCVVESVHELRHEKNLVVSRLRMWYEHFMGLQTILESAPRESPSSSLPALILYGHFLQTKIYAETSLELSQGRYDQYLSEFQTVIRVAERGLRQSLAGDQKYVQMFSFESCFLGMLYLCTLKCRQPTMRRQLIDLMRLSSEKEGLWHRGESITVASRVMELEEGRSEFIPAIGTLTRTATPLFHDVLCEINYVADGRTLVDVTYVLHQERTAEHEWLAMKETLVVVDR